MSSCRYKLSSLSTTSPPVCWVSVPLVYIYMSVCVCRHGIVSGARWVFFCLYIYVCVCVFAYVAMATSEHVVMQIEALLALNLITTGVLGQSASCLYIYIYICVYTDTGVCMCVCVCLWVYLWEWVVVQCVCMLVSIGVYMWVGLWGL